jgi:hypothetical protein
MGISGITDDRIYKIYNYTKNISPENFQLPPFDINYNILDLHKKRYFTKGELNKVEYYGVYDFPTDTHFDLVLTEFRKYLRINELVYKRELDIVWYYYDGTSGATKQTTKFYTQAESLGVGERRRRNCVTNLKIETVGLIMMASGVTQQEAEQIGWLFLEDYTTHINAYIEGAEDPLKNAILTTQSHPWLDWVIPNTGGLTVRLYLYDGINIDYTENNIYI